MSNAYLFDINTKSKFGMGGKLAVEFAELVQKLEASESRSLSPQVFKSTVGKFEPRFAGFQQHDAQEFMSRILEGLGDELNRVLVKEYHELPDADNKPDVEVARDHWDNTVARENHMMRVAEYLLHNQGLTTFDDAKSEALELACRLAICAWSQPVKRGSPFATQSSPCRGRPFSLVGLADR